MGVCGSKTEKTSQPTMKKPYVKKVGALNPDMSAYEPKSDLSHLRLGVTVEGMLHIMHELLQIIEHQPNARTEELSSVYHNITGWQISPGYKRRSSMEWANSAANVGPLRMDEGSHYRPSAGLQALAYDLNDKVREFLEKNNWEHLSMLEVVLTVPEYEHLRKFVGVAEVFYSHVQSRPVFDFDCGMMGMLQKTFRCGTLPRELDRMKEPYAHAQTPFVWLDTFSLKQCKNDFSVDAVLQLIEEIPYFVVELFLEYDGPDRSKGASKSLEYATRSFCILEVYGAILAMKRLYSTSNAGHQEEMSFALQKFPVDTASASARRPEDKEKVDKFIVDYVGFNIMDRQFTRAMHEFRSDR